MSDWVRENVASVLDRKIKCSRCDEEMITHYRHPFLEDCPCSILCIQCGYSLEITGVYKPKEKGSSLRMCKKDKRREEINEKNK